MAYSKAEGVAEPRPARIVVIAGRRQVRSPVKNRLLGILDDEDRLIIKRGEELVIVEVRKA